MAGARPPRVQQSSGAGLIPEAPPQPFLESASAAATTATAAPAEAARPAGPAGAEAAAALLLAAKDALLLLRALRRRERHHDVRDHLVANLHVAADELAERAVGHAVGDALALELL